MSGLPFRVGHGFDAHRFAAGRPLILGGVRVPHPEGLDGHSDADVLTHAVIDAVLGAVALGDLGRHFPPDDDRWKGADSLDLLRHALAMLSHKGARPEQVDCTVYLEKPRVGAHLDEMRARLAEAMNLPADRVSVKATTTEGMGFIGRGEGAAASAVALVSVKEA
jgi:2-C-methyl-D-erythritol 2,4-cyclodiphosphate synthase